MKDRDMAVANFVSGRDGSKGYLKICYACLETIYLHLDSDGIWRPYESWVAGNASEGEFIPHCCNSTETNSVLMRILA